MPEYIDREALYEKITALRSVDCAALYRGDVETAIKEAPTADVEEVVHGEWLEGNKRQSCSKCLYRGARAWSYCPVCGAKMDGKEKDHE